MVSRGSKSGLKMAFPAGNLGVKNAVNFKPGKIGHIG
jgi:hypothetical protein